MTMPRSGSSSVAVEPGGLLDDLTCGGTSTVATENDDMGVVDGILPVSSARTLGGPAVTARSEAGDNLAVHRAIYEARAGDVLVVTVGGDPHVAVWGEVMTVAALTRRLAGVVVDGVVRDIDAIERHGLPVFARGVTPRGPRKEHVGEVNTTIMLGGVTVSPGDIVVGDSSGVVIVPRADAVAVADRCRRACEVEQARLEAIRAGGSILEIFGYDARIPPELLPPRERDTRLA